MKQKFIHIISFISVTNNILTWLVVCDVGWIKKLLFFFFHFMYTISTLAYIFTDE
jgi:hypothetical protein